MAIYANCKGGLIIEGGVMLCEYGINVLFHSLGDNLIGNFVQSIEAISAPLDFQ